MKKGDLVCSKDKSVVGVVVDFSLTLHNVTIAVLWNEPPTAQGCKTFTLHNDNVILLPKGTKVIKHYKDDNYAWLRYDNYDSEKGLIKDIEGHNFTALNLHGVCDLEFEFVDDDIETKNNKQYTTLDIEPWDIMEADFTREEFIGFLKGNIIKYCLRKKGSDLQDFEKIEHYARKLQEVLKDETV